MANKTIAEYYAGGVFESVTYHAETPSELARMMVGWGTGWKRVRRYKNTPVEVAFTLKNGDHMVYLTHMDAL